ncbi:hypothetical protein ACFSUK_18520 [Sphingobium scionense]
MSEQQQGGRIVDAATIVANMKGEAAVLPGEIDGDARSTGPPRILAQLLETVAAIPREKARCAADRVLADGTVWMVAGRGMIISGLDDGPSVRLLAPPPPPSSRFADASWARRLPPG